MRNQSNCELPSFYSNHPAEDLVDQDSTVKPVIMLSVNNITYLHFHSILELGVCISGRGLCMVEEQSYPFQEGDVQIIFPFQKHLSQNAPGSYSRWVWIGINPIALLGNWGVPNLGRIERMLYTRMGLCGIIDKEKYPLIAQLIARVTLPGDRERRLACLLTLIEELSAVSADMPHFSLRPETEFLQIEPALKRIQQLIDQGIMPDIDHLCNACAVSQATFRRVFHRVLGQSPRAYVQCMQMRKAQRLLLLTRKSVTEIALSIGYSDVSGFNRMFLRTFGMAPRDYRAEYRRLTQ